MLEEHKAGPGKILVCDEKHGARYFSANTTEELHAAALKLVKERHWYYDEQYKAAIECTGSPPDGAAAWSLLLARTHHQYENVELVQVEGGGTTPAWFSTLSMHYGPDALRNAVRDRGLRLAMLMEIKLRRDEP